MTGLAERGFRCEAARAAIARHGFFIASRAAQWRIGDAARWDALREGDDGAVECRADRGRHGAAPGIWYAADAIDEPWSTHAVDEVEWNRAPHADPYIFFGGNYLNYLRSGLGPRQESFASWARRNLAAALRSSDGLEAALWHFGASADGGFAALAGQPAAAAASAIEALAIASPAQESPLAELLAESAAWLAGVAVRFGGDPDADPAAFDGGRTTYRSPFTHACRPVTLAVLTAGNVTGDESAAVAAKALPGFEAYAAGCALDCVEALGRYLAQADLVAGLPGRQSVAVHQLAPALDALAFVNLVARSLQHDAAVPAGPTLSAAGFVASMNASHAPTVVYGLTAPQLRERWLGNLFRYGLQPGASALAPPVVVDRDGDAAIDAASALPLPASRSDWSDAPDANLLAGGAAGRLPEPQSRRVYTEIASPDITDPRNRIAPGNVGLDRAALALAADDPASVDDVTEWLLSSRTLGDPGQHAPVVVSYPTQNLAVAFVATQDGLLHAFDVDSGVERWAWVPQALLPRVASLMRNEATTVRGHGIDGRLVVHRYDANGDGRVDAEAGEHHWLMFGLGRGGNRQYALDISNPDEPRVLWSLVLPAAGAAGSSPEPVIARLATGDPAQGGDGWVALLAGGPGLHVLDAVTGRRLWTAAPSAGAELRPAGFGETLASAPRAVDLDGDGRIDRAYLLDAGGGLWRFDFRNGGPPAELAITRRIARLGDGSHRFLASPDVSIAVVSGRRMFAIAAGSGEPGRSKNAIVERAYVVFDRGTIAEVTETDLHDATDRGTPIAASAPGWFLRLDAHGAGERVVGPSVTFDHMLRFQTWQPLPNSEAAPCGPPRAIRRLYTRDVQSGRPLNNVERPGEEELEEDMPGLPVALRFGFPEWPARDCADCRARPFGIVGTQVFDAGYAGDPVRTSWRRLPPADSP
ncbi:MAG: pilus assembly protein [Gammaproteobacteria bacterium]